MSNYVLNNRGHFHLKFFRRFKDIAVFVVGSLILPHPVRVAYTRRSEHATSAPPQNEMSTGVTSY